MEIEYDVERFLKENAYRLVDYREVPIGMLQTISNKIKTQNRVYGREWKLRKIYHDLAIPSRYVMLAQDLRELNVVLLPFGSFDVELLYMTRKK